MSDPILDSIADMVNDANEQIQRMEAVIAVAEEAGEDMTADKIRVREVKQRREKWAATLKNRGYNVK